MASSSSCPCERGSGKVQRGRVHTRRTSPALLVHVGLAVAGQRRHDADLRGEVHGRMKLGAVSQERQPMQMRRKATATHLVSCEEVRKVLLRRRVEARPETR
jgi:hypothetical protein